MDPSGAPAANTEATLDLRALVERLFAQRPHSVIETHISLVVLTDTDAYKFKKSVALPFVDQSTLEKRIQLVHDELRLNARFTPEIYLGVATFPRTPEVAVHMKRFTQEADALLERGLLTAELLDAFGEDLAACYKRLPASALDATRMHEDQRDNIRDLRQCPQASVGTLNALHQWIEAEFLRLHNVWPTRRACDGHGDLHLTNLIVLDGRLRAFDCLEFSERLRVVDPICDMCFLAMDLMSRGHDGLAMVFLSSYLEAAGDFEGLQVVDYFLVYRSLVRAKIAAIQARYDRMQLHLALALRIIAPRHPIAMIMCGYSGSGKSFVSQSLVQCSPAIRVRSDVERKRLAGLGKLERSFDNLRAVGGIYTAGFSEATYTRLRDVVRLCIMGARRNVVVDATFLSPARRREMRDFVRDSCGNARCCTVFCDAPEPVLRQRLRQRASDASEANESVLDQQLKTAVLPVGGDEQDVCRLDKSELIQYAEVVAFADTWRLH